MGILVICDHDGAALGAGTLKCCPAATQIGGDIDVLVAGHNVADIAKEAAAIDGVHASSQLILLN